jgi:hypothetical protein
MGCLVSLVKKNPALIMRFVYVFKRKHLDRSAVLGCNMGRTTSLGAAVGVTCLHPSSTGRHRINERF